MSDSNPFSRHCDQATLTPVTGTIRGTIPPWLNGTLTRNGPGIQKVGQDTYKHMFDGMAVVHRFHIENGNVTYNSRPLESDTYHKNMAAERIVVGEFGTVGIGDPCDTLFSKFKSLFVTTANAKKKTDEITDNCSVNVGFYGDQLYAMTETNYVRQIDPVTLKSIGEKTDLTDYLAINFASAHPHILPDGTALNLGINHRHKNGCYYVIVQVPPSFGSKDTSFKDAKILAEIPSRWRFYPGYYHSFGMTKDKLIFIEQPFCFSVPRFLTSRFLNSNSSFSDMYEWYPKEKTRFHVVSLVNGDIYPVIYETDNLFLFHHANAYEEDGHIFIDVSAYDHAEKVSNKQMDNNTHAKARSAHASLRRYVLPLDVSNAVSEENMMTLKSTQATATLRRGTNDIVDLTPQILHDAWFEFPRINYKFNGSKYRYMYGATSTIPHDLMDLPEPNILTKLDTTNGNILNWVGEKVWPAEPVFVPNPTVEHAAEDDGVIVSNLLHADDQLKTTLLILDAKTMKEVASVEFRTEGTVTTTLHGQWATTGDRVHLY